MNVGSKCLTALALLSVPVVASASLLAVTQDGNLMVSDSTLNVT
jgi:hypothetical protein